MDDSVIIFDEPFSCEAADDEAYYELVAACLDAHNLYKGVVWRRDYDCHGLYHEIKDGVIIGATLS